MRFGSLFAGIGGFDLGLERAGMECAWLSEINPQCRELLRSKFPGAFFHGDIRDLMTNLPEQVDLLCGGDPCPKHSKARSNGKSKSPDLSGYYLALAGRLRPEWVVRENVPSPTVEHFVNGLESLGYGATVIRINASSFTSQNRIRDFVIGCHSRSGWQLRGMFSDCENGPGPGSAKLGTRQVTPALTCHRTRYDSRDCYVYESGRLRILDCRERERLAGFPEGWTAGFSPATRARMCGNAVVPQVAEWIGRQIIEAIT